MSNPMRPMSKSERAALRWSIKRYGFLPQFPILRTPDKVKVDGFHREEICFEEGVTPIYREISFEEAAIINDVANVHRRHLAKGELAERLKALRIIMPHASRRSLAVALNTSEASVRRAEKADEKTTTDEDIRNIYENASGDASPDAANAPDDTPAGVPNRTALNKSGASNKSARKSRAVTPLGMGRLARLAQEADPNFGVGETRAEHGNIGGNGNTCPECGRPF